MLELISALPAGAPMDDALFPLLWATGCSNCYFYSCLRFLDKRWRLFSFEFS